MRHYLFTLTIRFLTFIATLLLTVTTVQAHPNSGISLAANTLKPVLGDLTQLRSQNIPVLYSDEALGVGFAYLTPEMEADLHKATHLMGKCGAFESLEGASHLSIKSVQASLENMRIMDQKNKLYSSAPFRISSLNWNQKVQDAIDAASETELRNWVQWLSKFPTRYNKGPDANKHVLELKTKLDQLAKNSTLPITVSLISHRSTPQKSIRFSIAGSRRPNEVVVLGGHLDSINGWGGSGLAPGADDNASGSSNLLEALRVVLKQPQPERTTEFFWYAGEESGLLGSAEIAAQYKQENKNVIAVLQLDMTLFPGEGELVLGNVTDFTSSWLHDYFISMNQVYLKARIVSDTCGYACSDHASWYRQGYSTLLPFEATTNTMNNNLHTVKDIIDNRSSFKHSLVFAKLAIVFALDLGNSELRSPL